MWLGTAVLFPELLLPYRAKIMFLEKKIIAIEVFCFYFDM